MKRKYIVGNWKMHKTLSEARNDFKHFSELTNSLSTADFAISAPAVFLSELGRAGPSKVKVLAQNCHWDSKGAFTGEISALMLRELNIKGSLVAHSERRQMNGETNLSAAKRVSALLTQGLEAIYCVGETLEERESGKLKDVLSKQIEIGLSLVDRTCAAQLLTIAYEPVWAIGTGKSASVNDANEAHSFIRLLLAETLGTSISSSVRILYGGSVNKQNVGEYLKASHIDGALVGGASLDPQGFAELCQLSLK